jgi:hypothetical protein
VYVKKYLKDKILSKITAIENDIPTHFIGTDD